MVALRVNARKHAHKHRLAERTRHTHTHELEHKLRRLLINCFAGKRERERDVGCGGEGLMGSREVQAR